MYEVCRIFYRKATSSSRNSGSLFVERAKTVVGNHHLKDCWFTVEIHLQEN